MSGRESSFESVKAMDAELAGLLRAGGVLRFRLGAGLEALARIGGHHDLGFSSLQAYALERCERSTRWVQESRALARRLEELPAVRRALLRGDIGFSMAQVVARGATPEDADIWLEAARARTVRGMRRLLMEPFANANAKKAGLGEPESPLQDEEPKVTLTVTAAREESWLFECTRMMVEREEGVGAALERTVDALLGEGTTSLLPLVPRESLAWFEDRATDGAQRAWEAELARWREAAEIRCEPQIAARAMDVRDTGSDEPTNLSFEGNALEIDAALRKLSADLATRDLEAGGLAEVFWRADGWRRLGYATDSQYARERLGTCLSAIKARRALSRRVTALPRLGDAIRERRLGYEAARLVAEVATEKTIDEWVARARQRTVRLLREEVDAVRMLSRVGAEDHVAPPNDETMERLAAIESRVITGVAFRAFGDGGTFTEGSAFTEGDTQLPPDGASESVGAGHLSARLLHDFEEARRAAKLRSRGKVTLKLRVSPGIARYYRWLEREYERHRPTAASFLRFLCSSLIDTWKHAPPTDVRYGNVYARDRYRCTSPVCGRRDVTPHHLRFRSAGGDDAGENLASLCVWCHLEGVHGGRLKALPPASAMTWAIGRTPHTRVEGRRRCEGAVRSRVP